MDETFKVLTLNCWALFFPFHTIRKDDRLRYLAKRLADGNYDIILLQEIWTDADFRMLQNSLVHVYQHSIYFHCHLIGMGLCIFTKWPMDSIFVHPFGANGHPHLIHQGDWYCGKGVGLARVTSKTGVRVNLYVTHLIARYELDRKKDRYDAHRAAQLLELMQFVRMTSTSADAFIVAGDFNLESDTSTIKFFRTFLGASDAWLHNNSIPETRTTEILEFDGCTCDRPDNPYRNDVWTKFYGNGERLDYIFYRAGPGPFDPTTSPNLIQLSCQSCWLDFREVPDERGLHYSDHEGVGAQFTFTRHAPSKSVGKPRIPDTKVIEPLMLELSNQLKHGMRRCRQERLHHLLLIILFTVIVLILFINAPNYHWVAAYFATVATGLFSVALFVLIWDVVVGRTVERRALENGKSSIALLLTNLPTARTAQTDQVEANDEVLAGCVDDEI